MAIARSDWSIAQKKMAPQEGATTIKDMLNSGKSCTVDSQE